MHQLLRSISKNVLKILSRLGYTLGLQKQKPVLVERNDRFVLSSSLTEDRTITLPVSEPYLEDHIYRYVEGKPVHVCCSYKSLKEILDLVEKTNMTDLEILARQGYIDMSDPY